MKKISWSQALMAAFALAVPATAVTLQQTLAMADETSEEGRIVEVSPSDGVDLPGIAENAQADVTPKYWIGLQGRPIDSAALRTHLQLANDVGVLVENVVPDSPAAKAGLQQHDVVVSVNGEPISDFRALQKVVAEGTDKPIELKIIRLAKEEKVTVTPEERPADALAKLNESVPGGLGLGNGEATNFDDVIRQLQEGALPGGMRAFGPGLEMGQQFNLNQMPNGISVSVQRNGEGPAEITVKKGDETWTVKSDDKEAIEKLPEDVRTVVEGMVSGSGGVRFGQLGGLPFNPAELQGALRGDVQGRERLEGARRGNDRLLKRMEEMEQQLHDLQQKLDEKSGVDRTTGGTTPSKD